MKMLLGKDDRRKKKLLLQELKQYSIVLKEDKALKTPVYIYLRECKREGSMSSNDYSLSLFY
jgi:hypothetical protein